MRRRTLKYIIPTFLLSLLFNFPKFFEAKILEREVRIVPEDVDPAAAASFRLGNGTSDGTTNNFTWVIINQLV